MPVSLALFGPHRYAALLGWLAMPVLLAQASAPTLVIEHLPAREILLSAGGIAALAIVLLLPLRTPQGLKPGLAPASIQGVRVTLCSHRRHQSGMLMPHRLARPSAWLLAGLACLFTPAAAVTVLPPIAGDWLTEGGDGVIQIAPCAAGLCGRIVGISRGPNEPMPVDVKGAPECGLTILTIDPQAQDGVWHGQVTDPRNGTAYKAEVRMNPHGRLLMRGYIVIPLLGQTQVWQRFIGYIADECRFVQGNGPTGAAGVEAAH